MTQPGAIGDDLDPTDTGIFTTTPWAELADSVSIQFGAGIAYSPTVLDEAFDDATVDSTFAPGGASRIPDGSGPWVRNDFDLSPILSGTPELGEAANTPGAPNELVDPIVVSSTASSFRSQTQKPTPILQPPKASSSSVAPTALHRWQSATP